MIQNFALAEKKSKAVSEWINSKIGDIYIRIDPDYIGCTFEY
jgi:hypothetical protein